MSCSGQQVLGGICASRTRKGHHGTGGLSCTGGAVWWSTKGGGASSRITFVGEMRNNPMAVMHEDLQIAGKRPMMILRRARQ